MLDLRTGLRLEHNNHDVELIAMTDHMDRSELWRVRILANNEHDTELFEPGDRIRFLNGGATYIL